MREACSGLVEAWEIPAGDKIKHFFIELGASLLTRGVKGRQLFGGDILVHDIVQTDYKVLHADWKGYLLARLLLGLKMYTFLKKNLN